MRRSITIVALLISALALACAIGCERTPDATASTESGRKTDGCAVAETDGAGCASAGEGGVTGCASAGEGGVTGCASAGEGGVTGCASAGEGGVTGCASAGEGGVTGCASAEGKVACAGHETKDGKRCDADRVCHGHADGAECTEDCTCPHYEDADGKCAYAVKDADGNVKCSCSHAAAEKKGTGKCPMSEDNAKTCPHASKTTEKPETS